MNSKSSLDRELTVYLEKKYSKVFLSPEEVERETLVNPNIVPSTSDKQNTWLLRDVVEFLNRPFYPKEIRQMGRREKKAYIIRATTETLNGLWGKTISLEAPIALEASLEASLSESQQIA
ncbi:MAG: hypothetical protein LBC09_01725 [Helicobacteraceae bacterium]|jgi:hypothetical protein|nr:hypothetical protein [Helicobacteraceae bacterium]